ncbi:MAG: mannitol dehydrogenase family protein [Chloroflexi bacterium]|nr:mannitol dehydrogenase family protein [Chloroflexota bacterium]
MEASKKTVSVRQARNLPGVTTFPRYDRSKLKAGIVHLGVGNFHRAHQALFYHEYLQTHAEDWLVHGIGPLESDKALTEAMQAQGNLYSLVERSGAEDVLKVIGSIKEVTLAPANPAGVIETLASDTIKIVSLTVTEKGYYYNSAGELETNHPVMQHDLKGDADGAPKSAFGYLFAAARQRRLKRGQPFTIMSCDNLPGNGHLTQRLLLKFAELKEPETARWIEENVFFPNSMVDRITPVVTPKTLALVRDKFGINDPAALASEDFIQWVLEDHFINGRPRLEEVGVQVTADVEPYEKLKVRLLNGSHSALSYPAYLMGYREVDRAMSDPLIYRFVQRYMDEDVTPTLPEVPGVDVEAYKVTLRERFSNPAISDQVQRLCLDGSAKMPNSTVPPLEVQLEKGGSIRWIAFALAAWYRYLEGVDEQGAPIEVADPQSERLVALARGNPGDAGEFLAIREIFGEAGRNARLNFEVRDALEDIRNLGTRQALTRWLDK